MNEIRMYLKTSGSIAELYKDFNLYKGSYQNVLLSVYVPKSLLYENEKNTFSNVVKTGAILTAQNGTKITTKAYYADYVKDETVLNVEYAVYSQHLPKEYVVYAGTQTVIANVVNLDITDPDSPVVLSVTTSQTANLVVQESAYLSDTDIVPPDELDTINARLSAINTQVNNLEQSVDGLEENKLDKQTMSSGQYRAYVVTPDGNQGTIGIIDGSVSSAEQLANNIARYDSFGRLATSTPTENQHATNKQYVDAADENLSNEIETLRQDIDSKSHFRGYLTTAEIQSLLNPDNGDYAWSSDTLTVWSYNGSAWVNTGNPVPDQTVPKGDSIPLPDAATGSAGDSTSYAGIDHVHPLSAIYESASAANTKWQAQGQVNETIFNTIEDVSTSLAGVIGEALSDIPLAPEQTGVAITGENTLAGASVSVDLASINLVPTPNLGQGQVLRDFGKNIHLDKVTINFDVTDLVVANQTGNGAIIDFQEEDGTHHYVAAQSLGIRGDRSPQTGRFYYTYVMGANTVFSKIIYSNNNTYQSGTLNRCWIVEGDSSVPYTPYIADGTSVNVTACGGNIYTPQNAILSNGVLSQNGYTFTRTVLTSSGEIYWDTDKINNAIRGKEVTLSCDVDVDGAHIGFQFNRGDTGTNAFGASSNGKLIVTTTVPEDMQWFRITIAVGNTTTKVLSNICINIGDTPLSFAEHEEKVYPATVGQSVEIVQYDKITNVFTDNAGVTVSAAFKQSTRYELDSKPVSLAGTYAERPTGTYPYVVLYTATDRSGETYRLEANADGSVSANWVQINGIYQHNIVMSQGNGPFFSVSIRNRDSFSYTFNRLIEWFNGKGINAQGKDYSDVAGAFKNGNGVLHIISHIRANGNGIQVSGVNITTGNVADFTINEVSSCTDTVITI